MACKRSAVRTRYAPYWKTSSLLRVGRFCVYAFLMKNKINSCEKLSRWHTPSDKSGNLSEEICPVGGSNETKAVNTQREQSRW